MLRRLMLKKLIGFVACFVAVAALSGVAPAADYPSRPVTIVVAFTPGGPSDVLSRIIGRRLQEILHQPFIVENRPGAGGNIAAEQVKNAAPDGYTLLMGNNSILATNAALYRKLSYDAEKDFAPISLVGTQANILVVNPGVPANSMAELIALAKASPGSLNFASSGHGAAAHLAGELFKTEAKINIVHVAYKGAAPALQDVVAGHVHMMFATAASVIGLIKNEKVRALAVTTPKRIPALPNVPTVAEAGISGYEVVLWHGLIGPKGMPPAIVNKINATVVNILKLKETDEQLQNDGVAPAGGSPQQFAAVIKNEIDVWRKVVTAANIKPE